MSAIAVEIALHDRGEERVGEDAALGLRDDEGDRVRALGDEAAGRAVGDVAEPRDRLLDRLARVRAAPWASGSRPGRRSRSRPPRAGDLLERRAAGRRRSAIFVIVFTSWDTMCIVSASTDESAYMPFVPVRRPSPRGSSADSEEVLMLIPARKTFRLLPRVLPLLAVLALLRRRLRRRRRRRGRRTRAQRRRRRAERRAGHPVGRPVRHVRLQGSRPVRRVHGAPPERHDRERRASSSSRTTTRRCRPISPAAPGSPTSRASRSRRIAEVDAATRPTSGST